MNNPYDPVDIEIHGLKEKARVITLSGILDKDCKHDLFGRPIKPEKIISICPICSTSIETILSYSDSQPYTIECPKCIVKKKEEIITFFVDPFLVNRIKRAEIFSTLFSTDKLKDLKIDEEKREEVFGFFEYEDVPLDNKSDLGIDFDDDDLLES